MIPVKRKLKKYRLHLVADAIVTHDVEIEASSPEEAEKILWKDCGIRHVKHDFFRIEKMINCPCEDI